MNTVFAYAIAILLAPALGTAIAGFVGLFAISMSRSPFVSIFIGAAGAWLSFRMTEISFAWLGVSFGWIALACVFIPIALNEGRRVAAASGEAQHHEKAVCAGAMLAAALFAGSRLL